MRPWPALLLLASACSEEGPAGGSEGTPGPEESASDEGLAYSARSSMGFGKESRLHTAKVLRLSGDLPMVVEIVDSEEKIGTLLPHLDAMMSGGLVTMEKVKVIRYSAHERD